MGMGIEMPSPRQPCILILNRFFVFPECQTDGRTATAIACGAIRHPL